MFITKKRFEEAICKAKLEVEEKMWRDRRMDEMEEHFHKRYNDLYERVRKLEYLCEKNQANDKEPCECANAL